MEKKRAEDFTESKQYLPEFMRDFHDQKDLFKAIHDLYSENETLKKMPNSWVDNHVFTIDYFLWFMGQHGYTLQKSRAKVKFYNIEATIELFNKKRIENMAEILKKPTDPNVSPTTNVTT